MANVVLHDRVKALSSDCWVLPQAARFGSVIVVPGSGNARLRVSFFRPFYGDYWILAFGPDQRWVLVGEPKRQFGWVLSRTPQLPPSELDAALTRAEALGYARHAFKATPQTQPLD